MTSKRWRGRGGAIVAAALLAFACRSAPVQKDFSGLKVGQTTAEVTALLGAPTIQESSSKDGVQVDYWSYLVAHYAFRHWSTYECLTFKGGKLTEWVADNGTGGHSQHLEQAAAKKPPAAK